VNLQHNYTYNRTLFHGALPRSCVPAGAGAQVASLTVPSGFACPHALARDLNYQLSRQANTWTGEFFVRPDVPPVSLSATASFRVNFGGWFGGVVGGLMTLPWLYLSIGRIRCVRAPSSHGMVACAIERERESAREDHARAVACARAGARSTRGARRG
jgi:hypothetical protein